jgi:hypothetical protein
MEYNLYLDMENNAALRVRASERLKEDLQILADLDRRKLSDYIRLVLMKTAEENKEVIKKVRQEKEATEQQRHNKK